MNTKVLYCKIMHSFSTICKNFDVNAILNLLKFHNIILYNFSDDFKPARLNPNVMNPNAPNDCEIVVTNNSLT